MAEPVEHRVGFLCKVEALVGASELFCQASHFIFLDVVLAVS